MDKPRGIFDFNTIFLENIDFFPLFYLTCGHFNNTIRQIPDTNVNTQIREGYRTFVRVCLPICAANTRRNHPQ